MRFSKVLIIIILILVIPFKGRASFTDAGFVYIGSAGADSGLQLVSWQAPILEVDGLKFKDLNKNGT